MANMPKNLNNDLENTQRTQGECRQSQKTMCEINNGNVNRERENLGNFLAVWWLGH